MFIDESLGLAKSASHESFFEPPLIESESGDDSSCSPLPAAALRPADADPLESLTYGVTKTPGNVSPPPVNCQLIHQLMLSII